MERGGKMVFNKLVVCYCHNLRDFNNWAEHQKLKRYNSYEYHDGKGTLYFASSENPTPSLVGRRINQIVIISDKLYYDVWLRLKATEVSDILKQNTLIISPRYPK